MADTLSTTSIHLDTTEKHSSTGTTPTSASPEIGLKINTIFGEWLLRMRRRKGLTLAELSVRTKVDIKTLHHWEKGRIDRPQPAKIRQLAEGLGIESEVIFEVLADAQTLDEADV